MVVTEQGTDISKIPAARTAELRKEIIQKQKEQSARKTRKIKQETTEEYKVEKWKLPDFKQRFIQENETRPKSEEATTEHEERATFKEHQQAPEIEDPEPR